MLGTVCISCLATKSIFTNYQGGLGRSDDGRQVALGQYRDLEAISDVVENYLCFTFVIMSGPDKVDYKEVLK